MPTPKKPRTARQLAADQRRKERTRLAKMNPARPSLAKPEPPVDREDIRLRDWVHKTVEDEPDLADRLRQVNKHDTFVPKATVYALTVLISFAAVLAVAGVTTFTVATIDQAQDRAIAAMEAAYARGLKAGLSAERLKDQSRIDNNGPDLTRWPSLEGGAVVVEPEPAEAPK